MKDDMRALSAFTGVPVLITGFADAIKMHDKRAHLKNLLQKLSGDDDPPVDQIIADRLRAEKDSVPPPVSTNPMFGERCSLSPVIGYREWFKRKDDGRIFRCEASAFGCVAIIHDGTEERDVIELNDALGWKSKTMPFSYVRVPTIRSITKKEDKT